jgi:hypothetical protein
MGNFQDITSSTVLYKIRQLMYCFWIAFGHRIRSDVPRTEHHSGGY